MFFVVFPRLRLRISALALPALLIMLSLEGVVPFLILAGSAALHESGHIAALLRAGYRYRRIDILPMGALIVGPEGMPDRDELAVALAGPAFSAAAAILSAALYAFTGGVYPLFSACINSFLFAFNLIPNKNLDGGKALYCLVSQKYEKETAERICPAVSAAFTAVFFVFAAAMWLVSGKNAGVLILFVSLASQLI